MTEIQLEVILENKVIYWLSQTKFKMVDVVSRDSWVQETAPSAFLPKTSFSWAVGRLPFLAEALSSYQKKES